MTVRKGDKISWRTTRGTVTATVTRITRDGIEAMTDDEIRLVAVISGG